MSNTTYPRSTARDAADDISKLASDASDTAAKLADGVSDVASRVSERASAIGKKAVDQFSATTDYFREHDANAMATDVKSWVKSNPTQALVTAAALGFVAACTAPQTVGTRVTTEDRSIGAVISDIVGDLEQIVRAEVRLAKAEFRKEFAKATRGAVLLVCGGVLLVLALGLVLLSAVYTIATVWPAWAAALSVAVVTAAAGGALAAAGRKHLSSVELPPQKTAATVRENLQWAKTRTK